MIALAYPGSAIVARSGRLAALSALVISVVSGAALGLEEPGVGVVLDYKPASARISIRRKGQQTPIAAKVGAVVQGGDRIDVPAAGSIELLLSDDAVHPFAGPGIFVVPATRPIGLVGRLFRGFEASFHGPNFSASADAVTRGADCGQYDRPEPIRVPILRAGAKIKAGARDLPLAWAGGCPPFEVTVRRGEKELGSRTGLPSRQARLEGLELTPGEHTVAIADGRSHRFVFSLTVVERGPEVPEDLRGDDTRLGVIARALWLADQEDGAWRVDSVEMLGPLIRDRNPLAGTLADVLLWKGPDRISQKE
jgi:hypothetical protein